MEKILDSLGGFYEHQSGLSDQHLLLDNVHTVFFRSLTEKARIDLSENKEGVTQQYVITPKYIEQGVESGKWHRDISGKALGLHLKDLGIQLTQVSIEEACPNIPEGIYYKKDQNTYKKNKQSYTEDLDLIFKKAIFKISDNLFKLYHPGIITLQTFPSCNSAEKALDGWVLWR